MTGLPLLHAAVAEAAAVDTVDGDLEVADEIEDCADAGISVTVEIS